MGSQKALTNAAKGANGLVLWHAPVTWSFTTVWFSDVSPTTRYAVAISHLAADKTISGFGDHSFRPGDSVKRQQFAKMIVRNLGLPVSQSDVCPFEDVTGDLDPNDPLYADYYVVVCAAHLLDGIPLDGLDPWDPMPRGEVAQVLWNSSNLE